MIKKTVKIGSSVLLAMAVLFIISVFLRTPSLTRVWDEDVRVLAGVAVADDGVVTLTNVRDWIYTKEAVVSKPYFDASFNPDDIVNLWLYEQILDGAGYIAHTFLVFEFTESYGPSRYLGISVETRRELGELYSIVGGALRSFEVTHIWATENDLVRRRVEHLDYPLTRFKLEVSDEFKSRLFTTLALETMQLAVAPEWYNTATNNCTSSLIRYANTSEPGAIPLHYSYVLTGRANEYLGELGYLDPAYKLDITRDFLASNSLR